MATTIDPNSAAAAVSPTAAAAAPGSTIGPVYIADTDSDADYSVVDDSADTDAEASTEGEDEAAPTLRSTLSLSEAFELLAFGAAAVAQAASDAAVAAAAADVVTAAAAAQAAPPPAPPGVPFLQSTGPWVAGSLYSVVPVAPLTAIPDNSEKWYAITAGRFVGLTNNPAISTAAVTGVSGALQNGYSTQAAALAVFNQCLNIGLVTVV